MSARSERTGRTRVVLGVDLATAHARLVAVDDDGYVLLEREAALPGVLVPEPGVREQRAAYLPVVLELLAAAVADLGSRATDVAGLCLTGTSGTLVPCDPAGRPTGPALLYNDQSSVMEADRLRESGIAATPTSPMARIGHLVAGGARLVLHTPDVVHAGLLGHVAPTDTSHALKTGIDPVAATWDTAALAVLGVASAAVPGLVHPGTLLGEIAPEVVAATGLPAGALVVAGMTDGCTAQIAAGAVTPGDSVGVLGTTLVLKAVATQEVRGLDGALYSHYAPDGTWWPGGASNVGARPVADEFGGSTDGGRRGLEEQAADAEAAVAVSYPLRGTGERFPFSRPDAVGFSVGPTPDPGSTYRTFLEGVAYVERLGLDVLRDHGVRPELHHLAGGASRSLLWSRIRATVLDVPVVRAHHASSGYGAALLALAAITRQPLADVVGRAISTDGEDVVDPIESDRERLRDGYGRFLEELRRRGLIDTTPEFITAQEAT